MANPRHILGFIAFFLSILKIALPEATATRFFEKNSTWYEKILPNPTLTANSSNYINDIIINSNGIGINSGEWSVPIFYADQNTPLRNITVTSTSTQVQQTIADNGWNLNVPIPPNAREAGFGATSSRDGHMVIIRRNTREAWDFYKAGYDSTKGYIDEASRVKKWDLSTDGLDQPHTGANPRVVALPLLHGLITYDEIVNQKQIDHALTFCYWAMPNTEPYSIYPVLNRNAGINSRQWALKGGMRIQLDPAVNITTLGLNPAGVIIARAMQEYGMILVENCGVGSNTLYAESLEHDSSRTWKGILNGLSGIPLNRLRVVEPIYPAGEPLPDYQNINIPAVVQPKITPQGGTFGSSISVTLKTTTLGASIHYTTDGTKPTTSSPLYTGPFTLTKNTTIKAIAFKSGYNYSRLAAESFVIGTDNTPPAPPNGLK